MPSFPVLEITPRRVSVPTFEYACSLLIIYILIVLLITSRSKEKKQNNKLWRLTTIVLFISLSFFICTNVWIQTQPSLGLTPSGSLSIKYKYIAPPVNTNITNQPYYAQAPLTIVTDNARKSSINGTVISSPRQPAVNKEIILHGTTNDGDIKFARIIATTFTDKEGKYSFNALQPGKYNIEIVEKRDESSYETSLPFYKNQHEVVIGENEHIINYNYDYSNPYKLDPQQ